MTSCLIDTSAWLWVLRRHPVQAIRQRIDDLLAAREVASTGMIHLELLSGTRTPDEWDDLAADLAVLRQLHPRAGTWLRAARLAFDLRRQGITLPNADILIAAVALENNVTLLHADVHFDRIAEHTELRVESYVRDIERGART